MSILGLQEAVALPAAAPVAVPAAVSAESGHDVRTILSFRQIEIFRAIMIAKSVSGAARMLNSAQPGLSRLLKHMESKLGFRLFYRSNGRLAPTQEALQLFDEVQFLYKDVERVEQLVRRLAAGGDGIFRVGAPPSLGHSMVPLILRRLCRKYKEFNLQFDILPMEQVSDYLIFQRGEYALTVFDVDHPNIVSECISKGRMVCAVHDSHPLASRKCISFKSLREERLISYEEGTAHFQAMEELYRLTAMRLNPGTRVRFAETALALVQQELGVAIVDEFTALQPRYPSVRILNLVEESFVPVYINRGRFTPRSAIGDAFDKVARKLFLEVSGGSDV
jgi:DNA-binding transcriptional LysR family regulator